MRAAIYGSGSLGTIIGAFIARSGEQIDLINRNKAHVAALREKGAHVTGTVDFIQPVNALLPDEMEGFYDIVFLITKQTSNAEAVPRIKDHLSPGGVIVTLQNGLPEEGIAAVVGRDYVYGCTVAWGATMMGPGVSQLTSEPDALTFGLEHRPDGPNPHFDEIVSLLSKMGRVDAEDNFVGTRWSKLLINASFSGMSTVMGCTFGETVTHKASRPIVHALIKECIDVSQALGVRIEPVQGKDICKLLDYKGPIKQTLARAILPIAIRKHAKLHASMLQDLQHGKLTEVASINGAVCEAGRKAGVPTPYNDKVVELIHAMEKGEIQPAEKNIEYFAQCSRKSR